MLLNIRLQKRQVKQSKGFTLLEITVALTVLLAICTIGMFAYQKLLEDAKEAACATNLETLTTAIELYVQEHGAIPAVLGDLELDHLDKAYAQVRKERGWYTSFSRALVDMHQSNEAYAAFLSWPKLKKFGVKKKFFICPENEGGNCSYGLNGNLTKRKWAKLRGNVLVVGDCSNPVFYSEEDLRTRHRDGDVAVTVTKNKKVRKKKRNKKMDADSVDAAAVDANDDGVVDNNDLV